jgi:hypothetical protein
MTCFRSQALVLELQVQNSSDVLKEGISRNLGDGQKVAGGAVHLTLLRERSPLALLAFRSGKDSSQYPLGVLLQSDGAGGSGIGRFRMELNSELAGAAVNRTAEHVVHAHALARVHERELEQLDVPVGLGGLLPARVDGKRTPHLKLSDLCQSFHALLILDCVGCFPAHAPLWQYRTLHSTWREAEPTDSGVVS